MRLLKRPLLAIAFMFLAYTVGFSTGFLVQQLNSKPLRGDIDGNGVVDVYDVNILVQEYGKSNNE